MYRATVPEHGAGHQDEPSEQPAETKDVDRTSGPTEDNSRDNPAPTEDEEQTKYKLQAMKWGLVPFWTKRSPDYGTVMKTINARDDSLAENRGMWTSMKKTKRCVVVAQGFYEWLKKGPGGRDKVPHYVKRADGRLMCFAGLWDCVRYEGSEERHFTYTIITTDSNKQLSFLHNRMPVVLENGSEELRAWLDLQRNEWTKELQALLKPFQGELECYPVSKDVGKVGNNSANFTVPVASSENKKNIANFFANATKSEGKDATSSPEKPHSETKIEMNSDEKPSESTVQQAQKAEADEPSHSHKRKLEDAPQLDSPRKATNTEAKSSSSPSKLLAKIATSPEKSQAQKKLRSATSNGTSKSPVKTGGGSQKITSFFGK